MSRVLLAAGVVVLLAACTPEHEYDQAAHAAALDEIGATVTGDMDVVTAAFAPACAADDATTWATGFLREGGDAAALVVSVEHMCPDRAEEYTEAVDTLVR